MDNYRKETIQMDAVKENTNEYVHLEMENETHNVYTFKDGITWKQTPLNCTACTDMRTPILWDYGI